MVKFISDVQLTEHWFICPVRICVCGDVCVCEFGVIAGQEKEKGGNASKAETQNREENTKVFGEENTKVF